MSMSKTNFEALAALVRFDLEFLKPKDREQVARELAAFCRSQNPRFDREKFLEACKPSYVGRNQRDTAQGAKRRIAQEAERREITANIERRGY